MTSSRLQSRTAPQSSHLGGTTTARGLRKVQNSYPELTSGRHNESKRTEESPEQLPSSHLGGTTTARGLRKVQNSSPELTSGRHNDSKRTEESPEQLPRAHIWEAQRQQEDRGKSRTATQSSHLGGTTTARGLRKVQNSSPELTSGRHNESKRTEESPEQLPSSHLGGTTTARGLRKVQNSSPELTSGRHNDSKRTEESPEQLPRAHIWEAQRQQEDRGKSRTATQNSHLGGTTTARGLRKVQNSSPELTSGRHNESKRTEESPEQLPRAHIWEAQQQQGD
uniref:Uncharacterized protein n=1 Tax=Branchiostoma floridae TaxID=7739 RepID=C3YV16_BRAFL|eukprot:XP_002599867.1 hypothetical protein BRAFLDRAFT_95557 [Branchiostoma floridae]